MSIKPIRKMEAVRSVNESSTYQTSFTEKDKIVTKYLKLKSAHRLQKNTVRQCMHNAMSPISAVSGYLELLEGRLGYGPGDEKIERYRKRIEEGIHEVEYILEQLQELVLGEDEEPEEFTAINLNGLIRAMKDRQIQSPYLQECRMRFGGADADLFIRGDLNRVELVVFNLVSVLAKYTSSKQVDILTSGENGEHAILQLLSGREKMPEEGFETIRSLLAGKEPTETGKTSQGLALSVAKEHIESMGGVVTADRSETKVWFRVAFPLCSAG